MEKSKINNSLCPESKKPKLNDKSKKTVTKLKKRKRSENVPNFAGIEAHPGHTKLPSRNKIASQEAIHFQNVKSSKKERKQKQHVQQIRQSKNREPKVSFLLLILIKVQILLNVQELCLNIRKCVSASIKLLSRVCNFTFC